jgi:hypothetical protein
VSSQFPSGRFVPSARSNPFPELNTGFMPGSDGRKAFFDPRGVPGYYRNDNYPPEAHNREYGCAPDDFDNRTWSHGNYAHYSEVPPDESYRQQTYDQARPRHSYAESGKTGTRPHADYHESPGTYASSAKQSKLSSRSRDPGSNAAC